MGVESGRLAFDAVAEVHVVADGVAFDVVRNFSFAGPLTISEDVAGEFDVVPDCGEKPTDDPFRYGYRNETILVQLPVTLGPFASTWSLVLSLRLLNFDPLYMS